MANIHGKRWVKQERLNPAGMRIGRASVEQLARNLTLLSSALSRQGLDADHRHDLREPLDSDQSRSRDGGVIVEDCLTLNREERHLFQNNAVRLATTKPDPSFRVEITGVAHAMVNSMPLRVNNFGKLCCLGAIKVFTRHDRTSHDDF